MGSFLPRSAPLAQHVDPAAVLAFLDAVDAHPDIELHSLMVVRHGHVVAEGWWTPYSPDRPHLLYSLSKSFTSTAAGFAQAEGLLDLDDPVVTHFPEFADDITDPRSRAIRVRHVASMASGHTRDMVSEAVLRDPAEPNRGFLLLPPDREPGSVFAYNQPCTYALGSIVQGRAGLPLTGYLRPRLFDPLGIDEVGWQEQPPGRQIGYSGLHARTEDVAKLGLLYLQRGRWGEVQLLAEKWVADATARQVDTPDEPNPDWRQGYGFQFWQSRHGYRGDGAFGQFCLVLPDADAVVVTTACTEQMQALLDAVWALLLPGFRDTIPDGGAAAREAEEQLATRLATRLAALELPPCAGRPEPGDWAPWVAGPFPVAGVSDGIPVVPALSSIGVSRASGCQLTLTEVDNAVTLPVGSGTWALSTPVDRRGQPVPVAASGGWLDDGTFRAEVVFVETPHRMEISCSLSGRVAEAVWRVPPLRPAKLADLHSPAER